MNHPAKEDRMICGIVSLAAAMPLVAVLSGTPASPQSQGTISGLARDASGAGISTRFGF
jgi:hypothetical protein